MEAHPSSRPRPVQGEDRPRVEGADAADAPPARRASKARRPPTAAEYEDYLQSLAEAAAEPEDEPWPEPDAVADEFDVEGESEAAELVEDDEEEPEDPEPELTEADRAEIAATVQAIRDGTYFEDEDEEDRPDPARVAAAEEAAKAAEAERRARIEAREKEKKEKLEAALAPGRDLPTRRFAEIYSGDTSLAELDDRTLGEHCRIALDEHDRLKELGHVAGLGPHLRLAQQAAKNLDAEAERRYRLGNATPWWHYHLDREEREAGLEHLDRLVERCEARLRDAPNKDARAEAKADLDARLELREDARRLAREAWGAGAAGGGAEAGGGGAEAGGGGDAAAKRSVDDVEAVRRALERAGEEPRRALDPAVASGEFDGVVVAIPQWVRHLIDALLNAGRTGAEKKLDGAGITPEVMAQLVFWSRRDGGRPKPCDRLVVDVTDWLIHRPDRLAGELTRSIDAVRRAIDKLQKLEIVELAGAAGDAEGQTPRYGPNGRRIRIRWEIVNAFLGEQTRIRRRSETRDRAPARKSAEGRKGRPS